MHRLLEVLMVLIAAAWPARRLQDYPDTATANGPQALPAVETPRQTTPAPSCATVTSNPGQIRRASTPAPSSQPRRVCHRGPPRTEHGSTTKSNPDPGQRAPGSRFVGTGRDGLGSR